MTNVPEESPLYPLLPLKDDGEPADIIILTTDQWEEFRSERRSDRRWRLALVVLLSIATAVGIYGAWNAWQEQIERKEAEVARRAVSEANQKILHNIEQQTSPERQVQQQAAIDSILKRFDCSQRVALEDAINQLVEQGLLRRPIDITDICPEGASP